MKKLFLTLIIILVIATGSISYYFDAIIKRGVEAFGQRSNVEMRLDDVSMRGLNGAALKGLYVGNPQGFSAGSAFRLGEVSVTVDPGSLPSDTIIIKEISIDAPEITYEVSERGANLSALGEAFSSATRGESTAETNDNSKGGKKVIIEHLYVRKGRMNIAAGFAGQSAGTAVAFPDLHLTDIGKDSGGTTMAQAASYLMGVVVQTAALVNAETIKGAVEGIGKNIQGTVDGFTGQADGTVKSLEQGAEDVKKQIRNLRDMF